MNTQQENGNPIKEAIESPLAKLKAKKKGVKKVKKHTTEGEGSSKISNKCYEKEIAKLQLELVKMQYWAAYPAGFTTALPRLHSAQVSASN
jgi:polyphosphate kinase 2 (PPK2 family)